jgi:CRP-like cAMP-binding protein
VNLPGEAVITEGDMGDRMFFVSSGVVEIVAAASGKSLRRVHL